MTSTSSASFIFRCSLALGLASASNPKIAGYASESDIEPHLDLDLDMAALASAGVTAYDSSAGDWTSQCYDNDGTSNAAECLDTDGATDGNCAGNEADEGTCQNEVASNNLNCVYHESPCLSKAGNGQLVCEATTDLAGNNCVFVPGGTAEVALMIYAADASIDVTSGASIPPDAAYKPDTSIPPRVDADPNAAGVGDPNFGNGRLTAINTKFYGCNSVKNLGTASAQCRNYRGFSTGAYAKMYKQTHYQSFLAFYTKGSPLTSSYENASHEHVPTYANEIIMAAMKNDATLVRSATCTGTTACDAWEGGDNDATECEDIGGGGVCTHATSTDNGDGNFEEGGASSFIPDDVRKQMIKKGTGFISNWMYVVREYEDAIDDCQNGDTSDNTGSVFAWDEAVAFYAGSLEGTTAADSGNSLDMPYRLAEKRCANFGTCTTTGHQISTVNTNVIALSQAGLALINAGECSAAIKVKELIVQQMIVPLIQGTLRYGFKLDSVDGLNDQSDKSLGEGFIFAAAVAPLVAKCRPKDGETIFNYFAWDTHLGDVTITGTGRDGYKSPKGITWPAGFLAVKEAFENNYECLNITCSDVGGLLNGDDYYPGAEPCTFQLEWEKSSASGSSSDSVPGFAVALIAVFGLLFCGAVAYVARLIVRERAGKPVFVASIVNPKTEMGAPPTAEANWA